VHHQSSEFNYTASARITVFQAVARTCFWAVLPIIGFSAPMVTSILLLHGMYSFFVHTQTVGKLGWLEHILVTPSHHRVHHASNKQYLDKNYSDVFIVWDKLFGTFVEEKEEPVYGLTQPLNSYSFLWQHFHFLLEIAYTIRKTSGISEKIKILFGPPDLIDSNVRIILERKFRIQSAKSPATQKLNRYVFWQIVFTISLLFIFILFEHHLGWFAKTLITGFILTTVINCGAILEQRQWIFKVEFIRAIISGMAVLSYLPPSLAAFLFIAFSVFSALQYNNLQQHYLRLVYRRV
jgi:hypothetical protein